MEKQKEDETMNEQENTLQVLNDQQAELTALSVRLLSPLSGS